MKRLIYNGGPAFPTTELDEGEVAYLHGMSLRDYFAAHAPGMADEWWQDSLGEGQSWLEARADWNYAYADAMIKARGL